MEVALKRVLIVDDEKFNIKALSYILSPAYDIIAEKQGCEVVTTSINQKPDIILLDIIMPDIDGYDVLAALKDNEETAEIPVILISGLHNLEAKSKSIALGAVDFITKPFSPEDVLSKIVTHIKKPD
jgi:PleD family two-component response regulator